MHIPHAAASALADSLGYYDTLSAVAADLSSALEDLYSEVWVCVGCVCGGGGVGACVYMWVGRACVGGQLWHPPAGSHADALAPHLDP